MRLRLSRGDQAANQRTLSVTTDATATVGDLAHALAAADPGPAGRPAPARPGARP
jgi:hypothetical protein